MRTTTKKKRVQDYLAGRTPERIGEREWNELLRELAPISESYLRELLRNTGLPFEQPFAGVRQSSYKELERSLLEMEKVYSAAVAAGDRGRAQYCRNVVIQAKDRARFSARSRPEKQAQKDEMVQWMLVWLDNPEVFPAWVKLRKQARELTEARSS